MSVSDMSPTAEGSALASDESVAGMVLPTGPSWQDQDGVLRDMWIQNHTPQAIGEALQRSVAAIMTRAARLGLPRRAAPGRKPGGQRATQEPKAPPRAYIKRAPKATTAPDEEVSAEPQPSPRICLMCLNSFLSQGRHNRICPTCKGSGEYATASALPNIHAPMS